MFDVFAECGDEFLEFRFEGIHRGDGLFRRQLLVGRCVKEVIFVAALNIHLTFKDGKSEIFVGGENNVVVTCPKVP